MSGEENRKGFIVWWDAEFRFLILFTKISVTDDWEKNTLNAFVLDKSLQGFDHLDLGQSWITWGSGSIVLTGR